MNTCFNPWLHKGSHKGPPQGPREESRAGRAALRWRWVLLCLVGLAGWAPWSGAAAASVLVAVAANFSAPMQAIAQAFMQDTGHQARLAVGSTGKLAAQIHNGAPFEVLLAADASTAQRLEAAQHAVVGTRFVYAQGRLVLWSARSGLVDAQGKVLFGKAFQYLAMADPQLAPYGAAAVQTLTALGLWPALRARVVQGESIAQAYQFVLSGNAQLGFVALSQTLDPSQGPGRIATAGSAWLVPAALHAPLLQEAVLLKPGQNSEAAQALLAYLRTPKARAIMRNYGYE